METFLHYVAEDIISKYGTDLSHIAVVFPNKRAALFLNEELAKISKTPLWAPSYFTISDLFKSFSALAIGDPIKLVCELYNSYEKITKKDETLDHFYDWGQLLISDFDDVDKNMADAKQVFSNVANIHSLDDVSYLSEEQKEILKTFFLNFSDDHNSKLKELFLSLWDKLGEIYNDFKIRLRKQHIAYEGMLYRDVIDSDRVEIKYRKYIFVGFNVLQKVEQRMFSFLKSEGVADFYWDYDNYYIKEKHARYQINESGKFISKYLKQFGNSLSEASDEIFNNFSKEKEITFVKAKTENIQARYVSDWLRQNNRYKDGKRTAIVMCDESLLQGIVHAIPTDDSTLAEEIKNINITTGYPLSQSPVASFISILLKLRILGKRNDGGFRFQFIKSVLSHPLAAYVSNQSQKLLDLLVKENNIYPHTSELSIDEGLALLFKQIENNLDLLDWLASILRIMSPKNDDILFEESLFKMYTIVNRLKGLVEKGELKIDIITLQKLIKQLISSASIPFHGEPAIGIQIMGVLETRNLDFTHVLLLSCNEGNMPKGIRDSSFIPYSIRKAYDLTTVDNKVAIYSYYFYRLIQRAKDITIVYNTSTENGNRGEMSRFMLQLMVESGHNINFVSLHAGQESQTEKPAIIEKDDSIMARLYSFKKLSPTAINTYQRCQLQFYYNYIAELKEPEDNLENGVTNRTLGNIFHNSSEELYKDFSSSGRMITEELIDKLSEKVHLEEIVDNMFKREIFGDDKSLWKEINYNGMQLISREVIIRYLQRLLEIDKKLAPFNILAAEADVFDKFKINTADKTHDVKIGGRIDRLDLVTNKDTGKRNIRVVDYKTGSKDIEGAIASVSEIFDTEKGNDKKHKDYYLQAMLYSTIVRHDMNFNPNGISVSPALIFIQKSFTENYDPTLYIGKEKILDIEDYEKEFKDGIQKVLSDIFNKTLPFYPTDNEKTCTFCPYKEICKA